MMTTVHVIAPFHSRLLKEKWSHCAFTQIALKQIEIFKRLGVRVIDYSNYGSESRADEHVALLSKPAFEECFSDDGLPGHKAEIGGSGWLKWIAPLAAALHRRVNAPGKHIVVHTFGDAAASLRQSTSTAHHFESHVGYDRAPFGVPRVYVSEAWRHFMWGKYPNDVGDRRYSWVILPYYDEKDWPLVEDPDDYVAFMGRITGDKGLATIQAVAGARPQWKFKIAGAGDAKSFNLPPNVEVVGLLPGKDRASFVGNARALLCPTEYMEPCAGVVCEAALTGTPTIASSWGGFTETIVRGETGYHAATLAEWVAGIEASKLLDRKHIAQQARARFGLDAAAKQYGHVLAQLLSLAGRGWYAGIDATPQAKSPSSRASRPTKRSGRAASRARTRRHVAAVRG